MDESTIIDDLTKLTGIVSRRTQVEQVPFVNDPEEEMKRIAAEEEDQRQRDEIYLATMQMNNEENDDANFGENL